MKIRVPEYFKDFKCIAARCEDSCCIGWEIDTDEVAMAKYRAMDTELGREIVEKTVHGYFPLGKNGRCAFLDDKGLCRIISEVGEGYLCDICREHPRYYNRVGNVTEGGIGLGCEEAARIVTRLNELPKLTEIEHSAPTLPSEEFSDVTEKLRDELFSVIFSENIESVAELYLKYAAVGDILAFDIITSMSSEITVPKLTSDSTVSDVLNREYANMLGFFEECEALDNELWSYYISVISDYKCDKILEILDTHRGLLYYFTHRYVVGGIMDITISRRILFALMASMTVAALSDAHYSSSYGEASIIKAAVMFSKNIEYSTENIDFILSGELDNYGN